MLELNKTYNMDCLEGLRLLDDESVNCCVTSPPYYGLRDYGQEGQIGLEPTMEEYIGKLVAVFREVWRVLRSDGTLWLNLGDSYAGSGKGGNRDNYGQDHSKGIKMFNTPAGLKPKDMMGIPWRVAFALQGHAVIPCATISQWADWLEAARAKNDWEMVRMVEDRLRLWSFTEALQADGWYLRQDIIWHKPNCMPESVTDRCTKAHEYLFILSKNARYYYDAAAIAEPIAESTANDKRLYDPDYEPKRPERGYLGNPSQGSGMLKPKGISDPPRGIKGVLGNQQKGNRKTFRGGGAYTEGKAFDNSGTAPADSRGNEPNISGKRNRRSVWTVSTAQNNVAHYATFPEELIKPCILAGCPEGGVVCDPFAGSNTTGKVANDTGRDFICFDIVKKYCDMANKRTRQIRLEVERYKARV